MSSAPIEQQSWAFALQLYAEPGVAESCLRLQSEAGVDVMLLLAVMFAGHRGIVLSPSDIGELAELSRPWREQIVQPLRALRIALKSGPQPAPNAVTEVLRNQIKASELQAERLQNDLLAAWLLHKAGASRAISQEERHAALSHVVALVCNGHPTGDIVPAIDAIAEAAQRIAASDPSGPRSN